MDLENPALTFVAFDLETTGLVSEIDRVVEIGAVRFAHDGRELGRFHQLINPLRPMSPSAQAIHGLSDADLADAPIVQDVLPVFLDYIGDPSSTALIAHNAAFDAGFLGCELQRVHIPLPPHRVFDTLALSRRCHPELPSHRLDALVQYHGLDPADAHRALADAMRVRDLWLKLDGAALPSSQHTSYPIHDPNEKMAPPHGWESIDHAAANGWRVRIEYDGGSRGLTPREITPRRFLQKGGITYLVAFCHLDFFEKSFRMEKIRAYEVLREPDTPPLHVEA